MKKLLQFILPYLKRVLIFIEQRIAAYKPFTETNINSLAPKIITDEKDLEKIQPYLISLKNALNTNFINNIAITGSYGSGKSTILKTFQSIYPEYEYLNISLATFADNKEDKNDFERKLEVSILQQMFYHVKPSKIPDSRFKRIINLTWANLLFLSCFFIIWLSSVIILFRFNYIDKLNPKGWAYKLPFDWGPFFLIITFLGGVGLYIKSIIRLFSNSKISKFSIKGEVELNEANDKSVFNQHLEEILYFFERTKFNVVIIEDVDRFDSTDIFTKLREINILVNNSDLIKRKICFVYAIKDEIFKISSERVKFFELIIPVIPFINPSNASDQLTKMIKAANLETVLSTDFTDDVVTFIDDIDMRLLINIFHEYKIYSTLLSQDLSQSNLFSIIVYKNMDPEDFGELPKRKGKLYKFLSGRANYANKLKENLRQTLDDTENSINSIEREAQIDIKELRAIYINSIISKLSNYKNFYTTAQINNLQALEDTHFNHIRSTTNIQYYGFLFNYNNNYTLGSVQSSNLTFEKIEKEISEISYVQREKNLADKSNGEIERLKKQLEDIKKEIAEIDSYGIKEIFEKTPIDEYIEDFKESDLLRYLLVNGYLNENYNDYISVFHAINLTQDDFTFEAKVKNGISLPYEHTLKNTSTVLERLQAKYFKREAIWNYTLLDEMLLSTTIDSFKRDYFFETLKPNSQNVYDFISGYINKEPKGLGDFIKHLVKYKQNLWGYLLFDSKYTLERIHMYIKLIFSYSEYSDICAMDELVALAKYLAEIQGFVFFTSSFSETKQLFQFIKEHDIQIKTLDRQVESPNEVFEFLFNNNAYEIIPDNIRTILQYLKIDFDPEKFNKSNYTLLKECAPSNMLDYLKNNINQYIGFIYFENSENNYESEDSIIELLNNSELTDDMKRRFIEHQTNHISILSDIIKKSDKEIALKYQTIKINWDNVYDYFISLEDTEFDKELVKYLNSENVYLSLSEIKIEDIHDADEDSIKEFCEILIYTDKLNINANTFLLKSIPYTYSSMDYTKTSKDKVTWMISNNFITLTVENFEGIKKQFEYLHITLVEKYEKEFIQRFDEFKLNSIDIELLLKSTSFSLPAKLEIIEAIDDTIIIKNSKIAESVCYLLPEDKSTPLRFEVFEAMFIANPSVDKKIKILNINNEKSDNIQLESFVEKLGEDYARLFVKQNKPVFANKTFNKNLFEILEKRNMISSFSTNQEKDEIKVVANY